MGRQASLIGLLAVGRKFAIEISDRAVELGSDGGP